MKILAIIGSTKVGNTSEAVRYFQQKITEKGKVDVEYLYLSDYNLEFCTGCHNCITIGEETCPHFQTVKLIEDKIIESDALILATPGYMFSVTGIMKNFLDHVAYNCHRPKYFGKKAFLISSCTKWQEKSVFAPMETWLSASGFNLVGKVYVEMLPLPMSGSQIDKTRKKLESAATKFYSELHKSEELKPDFGGIVIFYAFRTLCKIAPQILKADYKYFSDRNAYDKETKWYVPAKIPFLKHKIATFIERKMEKDISKLVDMDKLKDSSGIYRNKL